MNKFTCISIIIYLYSLSAFSQKTIAIDFDYNQFSSYFGELKSDYGYGLELPRNTYTEPFFLYDDSQNEKIYAVGRVTDSRGYDRYLIHRIYDGGEYTFLAFYDGSRFLFNRNNQIILENAPESEGGISNQFYEIKGDTIATDIFFTKCCTSTGFDTPIAFKAKVNFDLNEVGNPYVLSVDTCLFSSQFFDSTYLKNLQSKSENSYPGKDAAFELLLSNWIMPVNLFESGIRLFFYVEKEDGKLYATLRTEDANGTAIDTYRIGTRDKKTEKVVRNSLFRCPIIIKTSDGDIELTGDGSLQSYLK